MIIYYTRILQSDCMPNRIIQEHYSIRLVHKNVPCNISRKLLQIPLRMPYLWT